MSKVIGTNLTLVDVQPSREPNGLTTITYLYEGTGVAVDLAILGLPKDYGFRRVSADPPKVGLQVIIPNPTDSTSNEESSFKWEMPGQDDSKSLLEHPIVISWPRKFQQQFRSAFTGDDPAFGDTFDSKLAELRIRAKEFFAEGSKDYNQALAFFDQILGDTAYLVPQYVIRLSQTVGSRYSKQISDVNIGCIYTTTQLINEATANQTPLPGRYEYKIRNIKAQPNQSGVVVDSEYGGVNGYLWGWLKKNSTEGESAGGRIEIQTEWVLDLWAELIYPLAA